jgi:hypothetical protein
MENICLLHNPFYFSTFIFQFITEIFSDCKYDEPPYSDCDPFHLVKWRTLKLQSGPASCEASKNDTKQCSSDQFPPGIFVLKLSQLVFLKVEFLFLKAKLKVSGYLIFLLTFFTSAQKKSHISFVPLDNTVYLKYTEDKNMVRK